MKSILDRSFRYTPSTSTDLRKTFARLRREQRANVPVRDASQSKLASVEHLRGMGGSTAESQETRATEASVRGFWKAYRRHMGY